MAGLNPDLTEAWQLLCLNQFHDILTGTSVTEVFADARRDYARIMDMAEMAAAQAAAACALDTVSVANTAPTTGPRMMFCTETAGAAQIVDGGALFLFDDLPAYAMTRLAQSVQPDTPVTCRTEGDTAILENATLRVAVGPGGQLHSVYDKVAQREVLAEGQHGNQLQAFEDRPICWDAWDIDPDFEDRQETVQGHAAPEIVESGPLRAALRITTHWRNSRVTQAIRLCAHSNRIDFETEVDWHETHTLLKAAFPTTVTAPVAQFDIEWGMIERPTTRATAFDAARFEVPAQKWAQLAEPGYAVALLNDCKYGYDVKSATLRLTLIKSSTSPDPLADQGRHIFTYSLLPIPGADTRVLHHAAHDLNAPMRVVGATPHGAAQTVPLVRLVAGDVIVETVKPAEDGNGIILRLYEPSGQAQTVVLEYGCVIRSAERTKFDEEPFSTLAIHGRQADCAVGSFEIVSIRLCQTGEPTSGH